MFVALNEAKQYKVDALLSIQNVTVASVHMVWQVQ